MKSLFINFFYFFIVSVYCQDISYDEWDSVKIYNRVVRDIWAAWEYDGVVNCQPHYHNKSITYDGKVLLIGFDSICSPLDETSGFAMFSFSLEKASNIQLILRYIKTTFKPIKMSLDSKVVNFIGKYTGLEEFIISTPINMGFVRAGNHVLVFQTNLNKGQVFGLDRILIILSDEQWE